MNVAQWLNAIDLGQYEAMFREHEIDAGVLRDLVEADPSAHLCSTSCLETPCLDEHEE
jgi:hypothetical protein